MSRYRWTRVCLGAVASAIVAAATLTVMPAQADPGPPVPPTNLRAQADAIMRMDYTTFVEFKRTQRPGPFDWNDDGCSGPWGIRQVYRDLFNKPCQQHDFGYRNYGKGLKLGRDEDTRGWIDGRLLTEMKRLCNNNFSRWWQKANKYACLSEAGDVWIAVRHGGRSAFYG